MKRTARECKMLVPALVARVHGEPHPEAPKLRAHLRRCERCRREESELRRTLDCLQGLEGFMKSPVAAASPGWRRHLELSSPVWIVAAILVVACTLFSSQAAREPDPATSLAPPTDSSRRALRIASAPPAAQSRLSRHSFLGREMDDRIDLVERELASLAGGGLEGPVW